jgi:hypothetical protein
VAREVEEEVFLGQARAARRLLGGAGAGLVLLHADVPEVVVAAGGLRGPRRRAGRARGLLAPDEEVRVDVLLDGEDGVEQALDGLAPVLELVLGHPARVRRDGLDHAAVGLREVGVVLEEVDVAEHVRHDQLILDGAVGLQQEAVGRVGVDDDLVNLREAEVVHRLHAVVGLAERPVRVAAGQRVGADLVHHGGGHDLEARREGVEAEAARHLPDLFERLFEVFDLSVFHTGFEFRVSSSESSSPGGPSPGSRLQPATRNPKLPHAWIPRRPKNCLSAG